MNKRMRIVLLLTLSLLVLSLGASAAITQSPTAFEQAAKGGDDNVVVGIEVSAEEQFAADDFWTEEMIANAKPLPFPVYSKADVEAIQEMEANAGSGGAFPSAMPELDALLGMGDAAAMQPDEYPALETTEFTNGYGEQQYGYPPPFTRYPINSSWHMHRYFPYTAIGKFFFKIPNTSGTWTCSGGVSNQRTVWTAGHCVYTRGKGWHTNMIFIPAYKNWGNSREMFGRFTVISKQTLNGWINGKRAYDIGMVRVADKSGKKLYQYTGYFGFKYNQSATQHFHAFGYPGNITGGRFIWVCAASTAGRDSLEGPDPICIGCDMQHGSSGGPWLISYRPYASGANNYVNSVVSYGYPDTKPKEFYGPYFGDGAKNLWDWAKAQ